MVRGSDRVVIAVIGARLKCDNVEVILLPETGFGDVWAMTSEDGNETTDLSQVLQLGLHPEKF